MLVDSLRYGFTRKISNSSSSSSSRVFCSSSWCTSYRLDEKMTYVFCFLIDISKQTNRIDESKRRTLKVIDVWVLAITFDQQSCFDCCCVWLVENIFLLSALIFNSSKYFVRRCKVRMCSVLINQTCFISVQFIFDWSMRYEIQCRNERVRGGFFRLRWQFFVGVYHVHMYVWYVIWYSSISPFFFFSCHHVSLDDVQQSWQSEEKYCLIDYLE